MDNDIERQKKLEADSVQDGLLRYAKSYEFHKATDSKPVRDALGHCLKPLADVIRAEQLKLKTSQGQKLEKYLIPLASVHAEPAALITLGIMFNAISRSEFNEGTTPGVTSVVSEVGERCRIERSNVVPQNFSIFCWRFGSSAEVWDFLRNFWNFSGKFDSSIEVSDFPQKFFIFDGTFDFSTELCDFL
jgi:hypothetical protein